MSAPSEAALAWCERHAIDPGLLDRLGVLECNGRLVYPDGRTLSLNGKPPKVKQPAGQRLELWWPFGEPADGETVLITEGESDMLAAGSADPTLKIGAMPGTGYPAGRLAEDLRGVQAAILGFDGDDEGRKATTEKAGALEAAGVPCHDLAVPDELDLADCLAAQPRDERAKWLHERISDARPVELEPDDGLPPIPAYPLDALPDDMRALVEFAVASGLPAALAAGACLAVVAGAIGSKASIRVRGGWNERAILWPALIAPRGAGKSPAQALAFRPLRDHDALVDDDDPTIRLGDMTLEALARSVHAAGGSAVLDVDELAQLLRGMGEYKGGGGGDRGRLLSLWSGEPWSVTRVAGSRKATNSLDLRIPQPTVVVCGTLQPALHELLGGETDGFRPRWLPHLAAMPPAVFGLGADDDEAMATWETLVKQLLKARETERTWQLTTTGRLAFEDHRARWKQASSGVETATVCAALDKADRHLARISLVLAEATQAGRGDGKLGPDTIERAAAIVDFTLDCWRALPDVGGLGLSRRDEKLDRAVDRLREWLENHGGQATKRDLLRAHVAGVRKGADLDQLLDTWDDTYPGTMQVNVMPLTGGTPTTIVRAPVRRRS